MPYYRRNLVILWLATFLAGASYQQVIPFLPLFLEELGVVSHLSLWAGVVFSMHFVSAVVFQPFWGRLADQFGRKPMMVRAGICLGCIYLGMSMSTAPWHLALFRLLNGALTGFVPGAVALAATNTPKQLAARYVAALQTANAAGTIIGPAIGGLLAELFGFRGALRASGVTVLASTLLVLVAVQERNKVRIKPSTTLWQDAAMTLRHPVLFVVMLTVAFTAFGTTGLQPMLAMYLGELQGDAAKWLSGVVFSLPGLAFVLTAGLWTRLGEIRSYEDIIPVGLVLSGLTAISLSFARTLGSFSVMYFVLGAFIAALRPSASALIAVRVDDSYQGLAYGMQQSAFMLGGFVGPVFSGVVAGLTGTRWLFTWVGVALLCGAVWLRHLVAGWEAPRRQSALERASVAAGRM